MFLHLLYTYYSAVYTIIATYECGEALRCVELRESRHTEHTSHG